nr:MAG TPA: Myo-inositol hexaphosphate phosphohydrolase, protein tyrosine phosphatase, inositol [Bacteriophage sp.]
MFKNVVMTAYNSSKTYWLCTRNESVIYISCFH